MIFIIFQSQSTLPIFLESRKNTREDFFPSYFKLSKLTNSWRKTFKCVVYRIWLICWNNMQLPLSFKKCFKNNFQSSSKANNYPPMLYGWYYFMD